MEFDPGNYLNVESFTHKQNTKRYVSLAIQRCKEIISVSTDYNNSRYREFMKNAKDKFGFVPFWVVVRALTFGNASKFYKIMKDKEKQEIADNYGISHYELSNMIDIVIGFRNVVAHGERTYCVKLHRLRLNSNLNVYNKLNIPRNVYGDPLFGRCDIFLCLYHFVICCNTRIL
jgi:Abortive infection bacteriophage resistance protein